MKKEDYPERIYCEETSSVRRGNGVVKHAGYYANIPLRRKGWDQIEYIRADLVPTWHDMTEAIPYGVAMTVVDESGNTFVAWLTEDGRPYGGHCRWETSEYCGISDIVAWCPIPERNTND